MDSDIDMLENNIKPTDSSVAIAVSVSAPPALPPPDSQHPSPLAPSRDPDSASDAASAPPPPPSKPPKSRAGAKPASAKPKSKAARARSASPSPPPPVPPPPLRTIRLDIVLGGPDKYEVDVGALAKATGQRPATPPPAVKRYESESEHEGEGEGAPEDGAATTDGEKKKGKKVCMRACAPSYAQKKKNLASEYYDLTDPFIDDSELAQDERTFIAQTKQQGFYVFSGEVALLKEKAHHRHRAKKTALPAPEPIAGPSNYPHALQHPPASSSASAPPALANTPASASASAGTRDVPIALLSDGEDAGGKRKARGAADSPNGKKRRRVVDIHPFHPDLAVAIEDLKAAISKESWEPKGKFPPGIRPVLGAVALKAILLNEYNDNFFNLMPRIFPYNRFTMSKLIKRQIFPEHMALLVKRQDELLAELKDAADEGFPRAQEEHERSVAAWGARAARPLSPPAHAHARAEKKQEKARPEGDGGGGGGGGGSASAEGSPAPPDADGDARDGKAQAHAAPARKYKLTEGMKGTIWKLVCLSNECCRIENEKNSLEGSASQVSEQGLRKALYQKIVAAFPDGWMSSGQVSREVSVMKKKFEKEAMESES
ncbi:hypothetical protein BC834DRAFT_924981 [Gloeopeniophorella convolvens]|nr:hypothetical protein BC834DRAFT_924981 [Gloeopeniophorella convolvens]